MARTRSAASIHWVAIWSLAFSPGCGLDSVTWVRPNSLGVVAPHRPRHAMPEPSAWVVLGGAPTFRQTGVRDSGIGKGPRDVLGYKKAPKETTHEHTTESVGTSPDPLTVTFAVSYTPNELGRGSGVASRVRGIATRPPRVRRAVRRGRRNVSPSWETPPSSLSHTRGQPPPPGYRPGATPPQHHVLGVEARVHA